ncbi:hypothetical protein [Pseudomonas protegens]
MVDLMQQLDGPRTAQQELFYDLEDATAIIGWSVTELSSFARRARSPDEAISLMKICSLLTVQQEKLRTYANEVKVGTIVRAEENI